jgi:hypothetical protein
MSGRIPVRALQIAQVALLVPLLELERRMRRTGGPGIIPFELAGTPRRARRIMETWGPEGQAAARVSLLLDYPFLVTYSGLQLAGCHAASGALRRRGAPALADAGPAIGAMQVAAGAFDAAENTALLGVLAGRDDRLPALARACARAKFALLGIGWLYLGLGAAGRLTAPARRRRRWSRPWCRRAR